MEPTAFSLALHSTQKWSVVPVKHNHCSQASRRSQNRRPSRTAAPFREGPSLSSQAFSPPPFLARRGTSYASNDHSGGVATGSSSFCPCEVRCGLRPALQAPPPLLPPVGGNGLKLGCCNYDCQSQFSPLSLPFTASLSWQWYCCCGSYLPGNTRTSQIGAGSYGLCIPFASILLNYAAPCYLWAIQAAYG